MEEAGAWSVLPTCPPGRRVFVLSSTSRPRRRSAVRVPPTLLTIRQDRAGFCYASRGTKVARPGRLSMSALAPLTRDRAGVRRIGTNRCCWARCQIRGFRPEAPKDRQHRQPKRSASTSLRGSPTVLTPRPDQANTNKGPLTRERPYFLKRWKAGQYPPPPNRKLIPTVAICTLLVPLVVNVSPTRPRMGAPTGTVKLRLPSPR